jgi:hypothetical protein
MSGFVSFVSAGPAIPSFDIESVARPGAADVASRRSARARFSIMSAAPTSSRSASAGEAVGRAGLRPPLLVDYAATGASVVGC